MFLLAAHAYNLVSIHQGRGKGFRKGRRATVDTEKYFGLW